MSACALNSEKDKRKVAILVRLMTEKGDRVVKIYNGFKSGLKYAEVLKQFDNYLEPKANKSFFNVISSHLCDKNKKLCKCETNGAYMSSEISSTLTLLLEVYDQNDVD